MKAYTDFEQSKKLAEILPIESADMCYRIVAYNSNDAHEYQPYCFVGTLESDIPCWSLAALLELIPNYVINKVDDKIYANLYYGLKSSHDNLVDAAFEMIKELYELKML